jgi:hypothetical protein
MQVKRLTGPDAAHVVIYGKPSEKRKIDSSILSLTTHQHEQRNWHQRAFPLA